MLHRLAVDLKMDALLFQLSVFHIFNKILNDAAAAAYQVRRCSKGRRETVSFRGMKLIFFSPPSQELVTLGKYLVKRFISLAAQNDKAYVELLFWKNVGAVREMTEGYSKEGWALFFPVYITFIYVFF